MKTSDFSRGTVWGIRSGDLETLLERLPEAMKQESKSSISDRIREHAKLDAITFTENPDPTSRSEFKLQDGVAIIPISGTLSKRTSFFSFFFGGTSTARLQEVFTAAMEDPKVQAVLLSVDSPGGTIDGTEAAARTVFEARGEKPVVAFANGMMASAAYWIGSAADKIVVSKDAMVGSIGVVTLHTEYSKMDEMEGIHRTVLSSGRFKALGNNAEPLSDEAKKMIQSRLDTYYGIFVEDVARNRGVSAETVQKEMADGRIFIGQQAVDAGLADQVGGLEKAIDLALEMAPEGNTHHFYGANAPKGAIMGKENQNDQQAPVISTAAELKTHYPALAQDLIDEGAATVDVDAARSEETNRILGLARVHFGEEAAGKFEAIIKTGVTEEQYTAIRGGQQPDANGSEEADEVNKAKADMLDAIKKSGAQNPGAGGGEEPTKGFETLVEETMATKKCSRVEAMREVMKKHPKVHALYLKQANA
jgi:signal peptide peptidase SppA